MSSLLGMRRTFLSDFGHGTLPTDSSTAGPLPQSNFGDFQRVLQSLEPRYRFNRAQKLKTAGAKVSTAERAAVISDALAAQVSPVCWVTGLE